MTFSKEMYPHQENTPPEMDSLLDYFKQIVPHLFKKTKIELETLELPRVDPKVFQDLSQPGIELDILQGVKTPHIGLDTFQDLDQQLTKPNVLRGFEKQKTDIFKELNDLTANASREFEQAQLQAEALKGNTIRFFESRSRRPKSHATCDAKQTVEKNLIRNQPTDTQIFIVQKDDQNVKKALAKMGWLQKNILRYIYQEIQQTDEKIIRWQPAKYMRAEKITQSMRASWSKSKKKLLDRQLIDVIIDKNCLYQENTRNTINYISLTELGEKTAIWLINFQ